MLRTSIRCAQKLKQTTVFAKVHKNHGALSAAQGHREYSSGSGENVPNGYYAVAGAIGVGAGIVLWMNTRKTAQCDNWTGQPPIKVDVMKKSGEPKNSDRLKSFSLDKMPDIHAVKVEPEVSAALSSEDSPTSKSEVSETGCSEAKNELPSHIPFLIIGAGTAAMAAYRAIRSKDPKAKVLLIGEEEFNPYMRPPLSKDFWFTEDRSLIDNYKFSTWSGRPRSIFFESEQYFCKPDEVTNEKGGVAVASGRTVVKLNTATRVVTLNDGSEIGYDKCLIATGGSPRSLPALDEAGSGITCKTTLFRTINDYKRLDEIANSVKSVLVIGGGFLGSELAVALSYRGKNNGLRVTQCFPETGNMARVLPQYLSEWTTKEVKRYGVNVIPNASVTKASLSCCGDNVICTLSNGQKVEAEHIVIAVGLEPNTQLAESAGLEVDNKLGGFMVNAELEAASNVWVAGDAACFYDVKLGRRRVEHHDHAVVSGRLAGENMTGASKRFTHQSMFWSDLGPEVGYEAIGLVDSSLHTVSVFAKSSSEDTPQAAEQKSGESLRSDAEQDSVVSESSAPAPAGPDYGKGVIFYMKEKKVVGVVCWNVFNKIGIARKIIRDGAEHDDLTEVAKLFELYPNRSTENTDTS